MAYHWRNEFIYPIEVEVPFMFEPSSAREMEDVSLHDAIGDALPSEGLEEDTDQEEPNRAAWANVPVPNSIRNSPTMLSDGEQQYLIWLTQEKYQGFGAIVELGTFLGTSSMCLAEGLKRRGLNAKIRSFDLFEWEPSMQAKVDLPLNLGDDFLSYYFEQTAPWAPWIHAEKQNLMSYVWNDGPIEFLFIDSAKTWDLTNAVLKGFGSSLVPGRSRIILQDFIHPYAHCLPLIFDSRPDMWEEIENVSDGQTTAFRLLKPLDGPTGLQEYSESAFPVESAEVLFKRRIAHSSSRHAVCFQAALCRKYLIEGEFEKAEDARRRVRDDSAPGSIADGWADGYDDIEIYMGREGWDAFLGGDFATSKAKAERCFAARTEVSTHIRVLLGFSLLNLGDREQADRVIADALALDPGFLPARMYASETATRDGRFADAERSALEVLLAGPEDRSTNTWAFDLLKRAWLAQGKQVDVELPELAKFHPELAEFLAKSASDLQSSGENPA